MVIKRILLSFYYHELIMVNVSQGMGFWYKNIFRQDTVPVFCQEMSNVVESFGWLVHTHTFRYYGTYDSISIAIASQVTHELPRAHEKFGMKRGPLISLYFRFINRDIWSEKLISKRILNPLDIYICHTLQFYPQVRQVRREKRNKTKTKQNKTKQTVFVLFIEERI